MNLKFTVVTVVFNGEAVIRKTICLWNTMVLILNRFKTHARRRSEENG